jgi:hypothetical protein
VSRSSPLARSVPTSCPSRHPPCSSSSPSAHALRTRDGNSRPIALALQSALSAHAAAGARAPAGPGSTALRPTSSAAAFPGGPPAGPRWPNARPPASAQTALPPLRNTCSAPAATRAPAPSPAWLDSRSGPHSGASVLPALRHGNAAIAAWPADSSPAAPARHPSASTLKSQPAPIPRCVSALPHSSMSFPPGPPQKVFRLGDISIEGTRGHYQSGATVYKR